MALADLLLRGRPVRGPDIFRRLLSLSVKQARRVVVAVVGGTVLLLGIAMIVLPGPAFVVIPIGLAILATEFVWARRLLSRIKERARQVASTVTGAKTPGES